MIPDLTRAYPGGRWRKQSLTEVTGVVNGKDIRVTEEGGEFIAVVLPEKRAAAKGSDVVETVGRAAK